MAKFIVIDGLDGCGKATQTELLRQYLEKKGKKVVKITFPKYDSDSSAAVRMYLNGELGSDASALNPYMCGSFYAVDRFIQYVTDWKKYFDEDDNTVIVSDRYLSANIIHHGAKLDNREDIKNYSKWCYEYECSLCGLPKEDITIILTIKPEVSQKLLSNRYNGDNSKKDIHENNIEYLKSCHDRIATTIWDINNMELANWAHIDCTDESGEGILSREEVHNKLVSIVNEILKY